MSLIAGRGCRWPPRRDSVSPCAPLSGGRDTHDGHENSPILVFFSNLQGQVPGEHSVFPTGTQLGVRVEALEAFIQQMPPKAADALDKLLAPNEKEKLLTIIYALATDATPPINLSARWAAAETIESMADLAGVTVSAKTIQRRLKEIVETIAPRGKTSD